MVKRRKATAAFNRMKVSVSLPSQTKNGRPGQRRRRRRRRRKNSNIKQTEWTEDLREWNIYQTIIMTIIKGKNEKKKQHQNKIPEEREEKRENRIPEFLSAQSCCAAIMNDFTPITALLIPSSSTSTSSCRISWRVALDLLLLLSCFLLLLLLPPPFSLAFIVCPPLFRIFLFLVGRFQLFSVMATRVLVLRASISNSSRSSSSWEPPFWFPFHFAGMVR